MNFITRTLAPVALTVCVVHAGLAFGAAENPALAPSTLPFGAPRFDLIKDADYQSAIEEGIRQERANIDAIADDPAPPTFENTLVAMEKAGLTLNRVGNIFDSITQSNSNPVLDRIQSTEAPKLAAESDAIHLNAKLFSRIKVVHDRRDTLRLDPESAQLLEVTYQNFIHAGANLSEPDKQRLAEINEQEAQLSTSFKQKLVAATKAGMFVVDDRSQLAGLSDGAVAAAAQNATERGRPGKWVIPLQNTTQQPQLADLSERDTRAGLFDARWTATEKGDDNDTRPLIRRLAQLRAQKAALLGYPNYAAYSLYDQMARTPDVVLKFLGQLIGPTAAKAADEAKSIQAAIDEEGTHFDLKPWDWQRYSEKVKKQRYDLDGNEIRQYFELHTVLEKGVFYTAHELYGISFKRRTDLPVYQPDVMVYEVTDSNGSPLGLAYFDFFKRDNKNGGAWTGHFVEQSHLLKTKPVIYVVTNLPKPAPGQPALITFDDVVSIFHEFGHGLHGLFANENYASLSGTQVSRDFVEFPSQFNEHWASYPAVLKHYAINPTTGQTMPDALIVKIGRSRTWGQGYALGELLAACELDLKWHMLPPAAPLKDVDSFETAALRDSHTDFVNVPPRYRSSYFSHIWSGGYAAGYYAYQWSVMLDDDAFAWFVAHGGLTRANGQRFRDLILSRGHSEDYATMFRAFYGKDPDIGPMLEHRGLTLN